MKSIVTLLLLLASVLSLHAQKRTTMPTQYREFRPSVITLKDGRKLSQPLTNVFLKNSSLLYLTGTLTKEANMDNIVAVDFEDRSYINLNGQLAYLIDTVATNRLYCIELFDLDTYERNLRNNNNITNLSLGEQIATTTIDLNTEEDFMFPVFRHFYMLYQGEYVKMHERDIWRILPKEQRHIYKSIISQDDFSWTSPECLMQLLRAITSNQ